MASEEDAAVVRELIQDATNVLDWCAGPESFLVDDQRPPQPAIPEELRRAYAAAVDQLIEVFLPRVLAILSGEDPEFPMTEVLAVLAAAGWDGAMRDFKLQALDHAGRQTVMEVAGGGRREPGRLLRRAFRAFMGALNAALDSLKGIPGVGVIRELKDFTEGIVGD